MIVLTGDSHINALRLGAEALSERKVFPSKLPSKIGMLGNGKHTLREFSRTEGGRVTLIPRSYVAALQRLTGEDSFIAGQGIRYGICLGFHSPPVFRHPMWQRSRPTTLIDSPQQRPISSTLLEAIVDHNNQYILRLFDRLLDNGVDFFVVAAPPPRADHYCLRSIAPHVVLEVDRAFRARMCAQLDSRNIRYLLPPKETLSESGFLKDELANKAPNDYHHGNAIYGAVMMQSIVEALHRA